MATRTLTKEDAEKAVYGGCILGGGGGGWIYDGLEKTEEVFKLGNPTLASVDEFQDQDYVVCVSLVGAPSAKNMHVDTKQLIDTVKRMQKEFPHPIKALMTNENGASTTINGWLQSVATGLPFLDAPCNGRAHPTGSMGSLNLSEVPGYKSLQTFAGGKGEQQVEGAISASLDLSSSAVRAVSVQAGGMVGVCRNPVDISYIKKNAALGGITQAIELGQVFLAEPQGYGRIEAASAFLGGKIVQSGRVDHFELKESGGFDVGLVQIGQLELTVWNEYMTAEQDGQRLGTFPDLIMTFNTQTGAPVVSAEIKAGMDITVIIVPQENIKLSSTMFNHKLLKAIEPVIQRKIVGKE
ncbi:DUF917 family protein [Caldalkalibacillus horti]|uniref:DUF917 family protein n=1 Tax=Caldalkalibacillus horti TaxID=77523 RepID=A0ABT9W3T7_9BACI|nr:DUF917 family protein [Bacillus horti]MDQ0167920.1 DUF917 family protein [Bacillus horti]